VAAELFVDTSGWHPVVVRTEPRETPLTFVRGVGESPNLVVASTSDLERAALRDWLEPFDDQTFSLTDAVSFAVMAERGITEALALDRHFLAAGFRTVPLSGPG